MNEVVVRGWHTIDQVLEDHGELLHELLRFFREGEGTVIDSGEVQVVEDSRDVVFFFRGFVWGYDWFGREVFLVLVLCGLLAGIEALGLR